MRKTSKATTKKPKTVDPLKPKTKGSRAIWKGVISFGLVTVPVAVFSATRDYAFSFNQFRASDLSPIRYKKVAEVDGKEVAANEIVKGTKHEDKVIILDDNDMASINLPSLKVIDVQNFIDPSEVDNRMLEKSYFLEAINGGIKGYSILFKALVETGKVGVAKIALRNREYLAVIRPDEARDLIVLDVLRFTTELVEPELTPADEDLVSEQELELAKMLVESATGPFNAEQYTNTYVDALGKLLAEKAAGTFTVATSSTTINRPEAPCLLEQLRNSAALMAKKGRKAA